MMMIQRVLKGTFLTLVFIALYTSFYLGVISDSSRRETVEPTMTTTTSAVEESTPYGPDLYIGLGLSIASSVFIGSSFIIKKKSLLALGKAGGTRAGAGGYGYLRYWLWWAGLLSMGFGEVLNFVAYAFAPATLVTPLGALSVIVTALLSQYFLGEILNILGKIGCALCLLGATVVVIHAPQETEVSSMEDLKAKLVDPVFVVYVAVVVTASLVLIIHFGPRYGTRDVTIYIAICSLIGGFSVLGCKAIGLAVKYIQSIECNHALFDLIIKVDNSSKLLFPNGTSTGDIRRMVSNGFLFSRSHTVAPDELKGPFCSLKPSQALDIFNTSLVTPIYYVFFTACVILSSAMLFKEWKGLPAKDIIGVLSGFFTVVIGIFILHAFKDMDITWTGMSTLLLGGVVSESRRNSTEDTGNEVTPLSEEEEGLITSEPLSYGSNKRVY
ncbi:magnesium transporter NIPA2-like [Penaeus monodon]|uniref:magnesium transporter NIPA2-like n=1 Tax=Penaeus monodon TaxID=6687 RepID=UPI0018A703E0|nr:magnesium transporter NIPA2-like [Penaeus monodon]